MLLVQGVADAGGEPAERLAVDEHLAPREAAARVRAAGGVSDEQVVTDVAAAIEYLRGQPDANGKVGVIGYCTGGRQAMLAACQLDLDAAVDTAGSSQPQVSGHVAIAWRAPGHRVRQVRRRALNPPAL